MEIIQNKDDKLVFSAKIEESLINAIRRYVNQIPILAIDEVEIHKNDSPLYDETLANRIGLIPLKMEEINDEKKMPELKLETSKEGWVYSGELKGKIEIIYKEIPLTTLDENQEIKILAKTKIGRGEEHAKFSPGLIYYRNFAEIKIDKGCNLCEKCIDSCPKKILKIENKKIVIENSIECDMCDACVEFCKKNGKNAIQINPSEKLVISIESFGQLKTKEIFKKSIKELKKDILEVAKKIKKL